MSKREFELLMKDMQDLFDITATMSIPEEHVVDLHYMLGNLFKANKSHKDLKKAYILIERLMSNDVSFEFVNITPEERRLMIKQKGKNIF